MNKSGGSSNIFGEIRCERDNVMVGGLFYLIDAFDRKRSFRFDLFYSIDRDRPIFGVDLANRDLDVEPFLELILKRPNGRHFGQCVSCDHFRN